MKYPDDIIQVPPLYERQLKVEGGKFKKGIYVDEWGCSFVNREDGLMGIVHESLVGEWVDLKKLRMPEESLMVDRDAVNSFCRSTDKFTYAGSIVRPFERFQFLRTMEQSFYDVVMEEDGFIELLGILHEHFCKEVEAWCRTDIDAVFLMDDWGTQTGMMVAPEVMRKYFKPMYSDYCEIARRYGKKVFMHSDGYIAEIIEDLIDSGVDALNSQLFCMDMEELSRRYRGRITFWGEIDRQEMLPNGNPGEIKLAVDKVYHYLYERGGVIAQCEFGPGAKPANIEAVFEAWNKIEL